MNLYEPHVKGVVREKYFVEAESAEQARQMFADGDVTETHMSEVEDAEVEHVKEMDESER